MVWQTTGMGWGQGFQTPLSFVFSCFFSLTPCPHVIPTDNFPGSTLFCVKIIQKHYCDSCAPLSITLFTQFSYFRRFFRPIPAVLRFCKLETGSWDRYNVSTKPFRSAYCRSWSFIDVLVFSTMGSFSFDGQKRRLFRKRGLKLIPSGINSFCDQLFFSLSLLLQ